MGLSVALPKPLHPPSSVFVDEFDTSSNKKSSRYLREIDRRSILARLDHGEKQSALAKEFRVTRSAICNLNKHRDLVLARQHENPLAKHPKRPRDKQESESDIRTVVQVALEPTEQLIPLLKSCNISDSVFRDYCDRLIASIVEEVLVWTHNIASCGVAIAPGGSPMISIFQTIEPELPIGHINLNLPQFGSPEVEMIDLPSVITTHNVFLFYAFTDTAGRFRVAKSIRKLLNRGAMEEMLCLVTLAVSTFTIGELQREYPNLRIVTAHIEHEDKHGQKSKLHTLASRVTEIY
ncbi:hypothetical protein PHMEG_00012458 [Phytophthora megakarya]|uniref:Phosphoribosyltransferase domain-containing protein n=1 Tax=Phytophthora megakarya TaxID=4795 RepID=A0A225WA41_9STRA|nr:hypothetical protein PHMEG_00012458 [Phytophthora megakarya]